MSTPLPGAGLPVDLAGLRARHPQAFRVPWRARLATLGLVAGLLALAAYAMVRLDFSASRILGGLGRLGEFTVLMLPPSAHFRS